MGIGERYWWARLGWALVLVATSLIFARWYCADVLPADMGDRVNATVDALLAFDIVALLLGISLQATVKAMRARQQVVQVRAAIDGEPEAVPLASPILAPEGTSDTGRVVAAWPNARRLVIFAGVGALFFLALLLAFAPFLAEFILRAGHVPIPHWLLAVTNWLSPSGPRRRVPAVPQVWPPTAYLGSFLLLGGFTLFSLSQLLASLAKFVWQPACITADDEGLTWESVWGMRRQLRWGDARLLEIAQRSFPQRQPIPAKICRLWTLYGERAAIRWQEPEDTGSPFTSSFTRLAGSVRAHTHLEPRTLDPALLMLGTTLPWTTFDWMTPKLAVRFVLAVIIVACVAVGLTTPLILVCGGALLVVGLMSSLPKRSGPRQSAEAFDNSADAEPPTTFPADAVFEMTVGSASQFKVTQGVSFLMGLFVVAVGAFLLEQSIVHAYNLFGQPYIPATLAGVLIPVAMLLVGALVAIVAVRAKDTIVLANAVGIRKRWLLGDTLVPWEQIAGIRLYTVNGAPWYYQVTAMQRMRHISWPVIPFYPTRTPQEAGAVLLTPSQMAELVTQRTGKLIVQA